MVKIQQQTRNWNGQDTTTDKEVKGSRYNNRQWINYISAWPYLLRKHQRKTIKKQVAAFDRQQQIDRGKIGTTHMY